MYVPASSPYLQAVPINYKVDMVMTSRTQCESRLRRERSVGAGISREGLQNEAGRGKFWWYREERTGLAGLASIRRES